MFLALLVEADFYIAFFLSFLKMFRLNIVLSATLNCSPHCNFDLPSMSYELALVKTQTLYNRVALVAHLCEDFKPSTLLLQPSTAQVYVLFSFLFFVNVEGQLGYRSPDQ